VGAIKGLKIQLAVIEGVVANLHGEKARVFVQEHHCH